MAGRYDDFWRRPKPPRRAASHGLKAKSRRGDIGETWWSRRFVEVLESLGIGTRLRRGRSYARSGQVMDLVIEPGLVTARVQGSRRNPYAVRLTVPTLSEADWKRAQIELASDASFLARLLAGEMPHDVEEAFAGCTHQLFPSGRRELTTDCSCPDWANPCKHIAATLYILAERFDADPFLILAWRGRRREQLLADLRALRGSRATGEAEGVAASASDSAGRREQHATAKLPVDPVAFWRGEHVAEPRSIALDAAAPPEALLRQLGPAPVAVRGRELGTLLGPMYRALARGARRRAREV